SELARDRQDIGTHLADSVRGHALGTRTRGVATLVGRDGAIAGVAECLQLASPLLRRLREAMQEQDQLTVARTGGQRVEGELARANGDVAGRHGEGGEARGGGRA